MKFSLQEILNDNLDCFDNLSSHKRTTLYHISTCRTERKGTFVYECDNCKDTSKQYQSCGSRYCPKCSHHKGAQWLADREEEILPVPYLFITFTLPVRIQQIFQLNPSLCYKLFFSVCAKSIHNVFDYFLEKGAQVGGMSALHTWKQNNDYFPHVHMLMPAGYLSEDECEWKTLDENYMFPYKGLVGQYQKNLIDALAGLYRSGKLTLPSLKSDFQHEQAFRSYLKGNKPWNVKVIKTDTHPQYAFDYLSRYVYKTAISEERIEDYDGTHVKIRVKDRNTNTFERIKMTAKSFLHKFLNHILPKGFTRIRYFGILSCARKKRMLGCIRDLFNAAIPALTPKRIISSFERELDLARQKKGYPCSKCEQGLVSLIGVFPPLSTAAHDHPLYKPNLT